MSAPLSFPGHLRATVVLGLPLIGSQLAQFVIQLTDTVMIGWYGVTELAALVLANSIVFTLIVVGAGFGWAVMPLVAAAEARGDEVQVRRVTRMGLWASAGFCAVALPLLLSAGPLLRGIGQDPAVVALAEDYLRIAAWGLVPALAVMVLRSYLAALERARIVLWATLAAAVLNAVFNYAFIFGRLGMPELGVRGAALASVAMHGATAAVLVVYILRAVPRHALFVRLWRPDWPGLGQVARLGWPIALTNLAEVGLFTFSSVMMGWFGVTALAAHGIALQCATAMFMIHIGLSQAVTVRAGQAYGLGDPLRLRRAAGAAIALSAGVAVATIVLFLAIPETLISAFLDPAEPARGEIVAVGVSLLAAAALFQAADGAQVMALGILRGVQDTRRPMIYAAVSYWGLGAPAAWLLAFGLGLGGVGVWLGLAVGLSCAGALMMWRFWAGPVLRRMDRAG